MAEPTVFQTPNLYGPAQSFGLTNRYDYKGLDPELALAERAADQRQLIANAILNQSSVPRRGKMVGRLYQKAHWAEGLGQLGEAAAGMYLSNEIQKARKVAEETSQKGQAAELAAYREAIDPRAATDAEMVPNIRGANAGKIAEAMLAQSGVAPLKGQYAPQAPGAYQVAQFDQPRAEVDPAVQAQAAAQADEQAAAQAAYAVNPNAGGYNMNNAPEAVLNPAPAPAAMTRPEVPSVDLAQQAGMLERPAQAAFTPTPQQERAAIAALRTSQFSRNRELGKEEFERVNQESLQRRHDAERAQDQALHLTERGQDEAYRSATAAETARFHKAEELYKTNTAAETVTHNRNIEKAGKDQVAILAETARHNRATEENTRLREARAAYNAEHKTLPMYAQKSFVEIKGNMRLVDDAINLASGKAVGTAKGDTSATGIKSYLPESALQRVDPAGVSTRAALANISSMVIHDRAGTAQSAGEMARLKPFIPNSTDDQATIIKKLQGFRTMYSSMQTELRDFYEGNGYKVPSSASSPSNPTPPAGGKQTAVDSNQDPVISELVKKYSKTP